MSDQPTFKPSPSYPCAHCSEDYSWSAEELYWSDRRDNWVCEMCWSQPYDDGDHETEEEKGVRLSTYLAQEKP